MKVESDFQFLIKIVVVGDSGVGKTNFIFQFIEGKFSEMYISTTGFDYKSKVINLPNYKKKVKLQVWDTAGQERYMSVNKNIFQRVQGLVLMYDITDRDSFEHITNWLNLISQVVPNKPLILVGNKIDLSEKERIVSEEEAKKIASKNNIDFFEASGYSGENVEKVFESIAEKIYTNLVQEGLDNSDNNISINSIDDNQKKKCCG